MGFSRGGAARESGAGKRRGKAARESVQRRLIAEKRRE